MEKYCYNYDFLHEWMEQEGKTVTEIKDALGVGDKNNIYFWAGISKAQRDQKARGEQPDRRPMPLKHILRLCNVFDIPLERFFLPFGSRLPISAEKGRPQESDRIRHLQSELKHERALRQAYQQTVESQKITIDALLHKGL